MNSRDLPYEQLADMAQNGSPLLLHAVGRAFGLGADERQALATGRIPGWFWIVLGLGAGVFVGVRVHQAWPNRLPPWLTGKGSL